TALRSLFAGDAPPDWTSEAYLRFPTRAIPLYLGAMSPRMLRLIGEAADGGLPLLFPPEHYAEVIGHIRDGAAAAGRDLRAINVAACVWVSVAEDRAAADDALREKIAYYGHALSDTILARLGLTRADFAPIERALHVERDLARAKALVTEPMLRIGILGTGRD